MLAWYNRSLISLNFNLHKKDNISTKMYRAIFFSLTKFYGLYILLVIIYKTKILVTTVRYPLFTQWLLDSWVIDSLWASCDEIISSIAPLIQSVLPRKSSDGAVKKLKGTSSFVSKQASCCEANIIRRHFSCFSQWLFSFVLIFLTDKDQTIAPKSIPIGCISRYGWLMARCIRRVSFLFLEPFYCAIHTV